jgi:RHS repeat-associated protein
MTSDGIRSFTWNARDQLTAIGSTTYQYDAAGRRSRNGSGVSFVYDGLNPVQEIASGTPRANLVTGGLDEFFARTDSGGTLSFVTDALGSTLGLGDSSGTVQTQYTYDPFGKTTASGSSSTNTFQFTGRENDGTGLQYMRARYYHPGLQRFISEDPLGFGGGDINVYVYAGNDPIDFSDPFGLNKNPRGGSGGGPWVVNGVVAYTSAAYGIATGLPDEAPYGAISAGAGLGFTLADAALEGSKVIPVAGNVLSGLTGLYDGYQLAKTIQGCW